jgi:multidrug resistance efflux pump
MGLVTLVVAALIVGIGWYWHYTRVAEAAANALPTVEIDRGDIPIYVVETGSLESANNATVKVQVEALLGTVTNPNATSGQGTRTAGGGGGGNRGGGGGGTRTTTSSVGTSGGLSGGGVAGAAGLSSSNSAAAKAKSVLTAAGTADVAAVGSSTAGAQAAGGAATGTSTAGAGGTSTGGQTGTTQGIQAPTVRSFSYTVTPHVPLRPQTAKSAATVQKKQAPMPQQGGFGSNNQMQDQKGSTTILWILPEGTEVKPLGDDCKKESSVTEQGDAQACADCGAWHVVCKLDSAAFEDEVLAQTVRYQQAEAWVDQARSLYAVNEISLGEYKDGILPQDRALIAGYKKQCDLELTRCKETLDWSKDAYEKGYRSYSQYHTDQLSLQRAEEQRKEADMMAYRLEKYSAPRLVSNLEAKSQSIKSDLLSQEAALKVEADRLKRLKQMIEYCLMWAPREGIVVYANQGSDWGRKEITINEGATVRERQPVFNLPDPTHMSVRVKINESKIAYVDNDLTADILVEAFPDRPMTGKVGEVTVISAPATRMSDVKIYYAVVKIDGGGFEGLKPGLTAQVSFHVDDRKDVIRIPLGSVRWVENEPFAARSYGAGSVTWLPLELGKTGLQYAEVVRGLRVGERVVADPQGLPLPEKMPVLVREDASSIDVGKGR